jgi:Gram-negative bacterial TonB protein C-terminal
VDELLIFQGHKSEMTILRARPLPSPGSAPKVTITPASRARAPRFLVPWAARSSGWWDSLKTICTRVPRQSFYRSIDLFRQTPVAPFRFMGRPLSFSLVLHFAGILVLPFLLAYSRSSDANSYVAYEQPERLIYYQIPKHDPFEKLPRIIPSGDGGQPGAGQLQAILQKIGSTTSAKRIVIVSKPIRPDNNRQTIYQPATPPDLHIDMELKLPNVVGGTSTAVPKPQIHFAPNNSKPVQTHRTATKATAPTLAETNASVPTSLPAATVAQPHLAVPLNESRPLQARVVIGQVSEPSLSTANVATATKLGDSYGASQPAAPAAPPSDADTSGTGKSSNVNSVQTAGDGSGIVVIGVDPAEAAALVNLPPGNRWGDFSIAPGGGQPGAVGGSENGVPGAGSHSNGAGGDRVTGVGHGYSGGGGGSNGSSGSVSISGDTGGNGDGMLDPTIVRDMVFAVPSTVVLRKNALVVSSGPVGGGGLDAYGALHCPKIYTVFLAMPGKSWTLEYCQSSGAAANPPAERRSAVVHLEQGLIPPDAESRFDFKRLPVPFEKRNKPIVLKGVIKEDGTVDNLSVYQGIVPAMDEAARAAFIRWKFKPALKAGKPVAIDILVGVPTEFQTARPQ